MRYNVYDSSQNIIGHVDAEEPVEAWSKAKRIYEATGSMVFDVRVSEENIISETYAEHSARIRQEKEEEHYREKGFRIVHAGVSRRSYALVDIATDLKTSMLEEQTAATLYKQRAENARNNGDEVTAKLWEHIADEEIGHYNEFKDRLDSL